MSISSTDLDSEKVEYKEEHMLVMLELYIQYQHDSFNYYENKAQQYATISSILGALIAAFIFSGQSLSILETGLLIALISATFLSLSATVWIMRLKSWKTTIDVNMIDFILDRLDEITSYNHYQDCLFTYKKVIKNNELILDDKQLWLPRIRGCIIVQILSSFFLILFHYLA